MLSLKTQSNMLGTAQGPGKASVNMPSSHSRLTPPSLFPPATRCGSIIALHRRATHVAQQPGGVGSTSPRYKGVMASERSTSPQSQSCKDSSSPGPGWAEGDAHGAAASWPGSRSRHQQAHGPCSILALSPSSHKPHPEGLRQPSVVTRVRARSPQSAFWTQPHAATMHLDPGPVCKDVRQNPPSATLSLGQNT